MTYNIHRGRGIDGRLDLGRIAEVVASFEPDVVALQEVDIGRERSGRVDQAHELATRLGMDMVFVPNIEWSPRERYGLATLTKLPIRSSRHLKLPLTPYRHHRSEPRSSLITLLGWQDHVVEMINTHLSVLFRERSGQVAAIARELGTEALIIAGDFNMTPWSPAYKVLARGLASATRFARTWPAPAPFIPLDHILYRGEVEVTRALAWNGGPARFASDHLPVAVELTAA